MSSEALVRTFAEGWAGYHRLLVGAIRGLSPEQLAVRPAPGAWSVWQLAGHVAGARAYWLHDVFGEGDPSLREMFRVASTTVPDLPLEDAGWEDDEDHPRTADELVEGLERTWALIDDCLRRWTEDDLAVEFTRHRPGRTQTMSRAGLVWHLVEHDLHHGGEVSLILGSHGIPAIDL